jgi:hypothetical protein
MVHVLEHMPGGPTRTIKDIDIIKAMAPIYGLPLAGAITGSVIANKLQGRYEMTKKAQNILEKIGVNKYKILNAVVDRANKYSPKAAAMGNAMVAGKVGFKNKDMLKTLKPGSKTHDEGRAMISTFQAMLPRNPHPEVKKYISNRLDAIAETGPALMAAKGSGHMGDTKAEMDLITKALNKLRAKK